MALYHMKKPKPWKKRAVITYDSCYRQKADNINRICRLVKEFYMKYKI